MNLIECPRDAMQGLQAFIPTPRKAEYINALLKVGFHTIDFGSFVSPKTIPQMRDTRVLLDLLNLDQTNTKLLAIIANLRGAKEAAEQEKVTYLGFPLSISETFQQRNTNKTIAEAFQELTDIQNIATKNGKTLVVYLSMGFGNPYGEPYNSEIVTNMVAKLQVMDVKIVSLADTTGSSSPDLIATLYKQVTKDFPNMTVGIHLHSSAATASSKIKTAIEAGCSRIDSTIFGIGGCPMAKDDLVGNISTQEVLSILQSKNIETGIDLTALKEAIAISSTIFHIS